MDTLMLFGATLLCLFLAFRTCDSVVQRSGSNDTPIDLRDGVLGAALVVGLWLLTGWLGWVWSPQALRVQLHGATAVELSIVMMLVVSWIVLPGFVLGLITRRVWQVLDSRRTSGRKGR